MTLTARIIASIVAFTGILALVVGFNGIRIFDRVETALLSLNAKNANAAAVAVLQGSENMLIQHARTVTRERAVIAAIQENDVDTIQTSMVSTFNRISAKGEISDLVIFDAAGAPLAEFTTSTFANRSSAKLDIVEQVMETGRRGFVVSQLDDHRVAAIAVVPLLAGRNRVGYALLARDASMHLQAVANSLGGQAMLVNKSSTGDVTVRSFAASEQPIAASAEEGAFDPTQDDAFRDALIAAVTEQTRVESNAFGVLSVGSSSFVVARAVFDLGPNLGQSQIISLIDYSEQARQQQTTVTRAAMTTCAIIAGLLLALLLGLGRQLRPLREGAEALAAAARDETPEPLRYHSTAREISALSNAIETLLRKRDEEVATAAEMSKVVAACARGDFSRQIPMEGKVGLFADLCSDVNQISQSADEGLTAIRDGLEQLAKGNLSFDMPDHLQGVFGEIACSMEETMASLTDALLLVSNASREIGGSAARLNQNAEELAHNTERDAAALEETSAALEEMTRTVTGAAGSADDACQKVKDVSGQASSGEALMQRALDAMAEIEQSSSDINLGLKMIEDIAFQTNLLALNAGVEAARAGETGRGFAVVAGEVRQLAQRSAESALAISNLISSSQGSIDRGSAALQQSGTAFRDIVAALQETNTSLEDIATATRDAASGVTEINSATSELDRSTQRNAISFVETRETVQVVDAQSRSLMSAIASFELRGNGKRSAQRSTARAA